MNAMEEKLLVIEDELNSLRQGYSIGAKHGKELLRGLQKLYVSQVMEVMDEMIEAEEFE